MIHLGLFLFKGGFHICTRDASMINPDFYN